MNLRRKLKCCVMAACCAAASSMVACKGSTELSPTPASSTSSPVRTSLPGSVDSDVSASRGEAPAAIQAAAAVEAEAPRKPDVIYVPTPQPVVDKMLELAKVTSDDLVYDLGCGDGRIVVTAAKRYGARAVGFEIDPERVAEARENVRRSGVEDRVTIEQRDIFTLDLAPANVVTLYLLPSLNVRLIPQLSQLRPGSRVVSHDFDIQGVVPVQTLTLRPEEDKLPHSIFLFEIPLKKEN
jgi:SAM-dependent methyltransferase